MKILYKDGIKTTCRDDHPEPEGFEVIQIPAGYSIVELVIFDGVETEVVKNIDVIKKEINLISTGG